jgi:DNA (cytosine-5)-methyltransferase 1
MREIIVDSFAGGGGASTGIEIALGRSPDIAINHDGEALSMHERNHPTTWHIRHDVWKVDPIAATQGRPVGLMWASPDCKHFSKAKGGEPREKGIRDLAWVVVRWAEQVRPRVILLENVEEFQTWGPLTADRQPCPARRGETFRRWVGELERLGYRVEWRELRACDYGAPTIRKRLFLVARCDGRPIVWPEPTHGDPKSESVVSGRLAPWRTAAEIIDWSIPCPSIFLTREEGRAIGVNRPLAEATMARIAKGVQRYVLEAAKPFVVPLTHHGAARIYPLDEPTRTVTGAKRGETALVAPHVVPICHTKNAPTAHDIAAPLRTVTTAKGGELSLVAPYLVPRYGERDGQEPRTRSIEEPMATVVTTGNEGSLVAPLIVKNNFGEKPHYPVDEPVRTIVAGGNHHMLIAGHVQRQFGASVGSDAGEPIGTTTAGGGGKSAVVTAFLAQHNVGVVGHDVREPVSTLTAKGCQQAVVEVSAGMVDLHGSDRRGRPITAPAPTITAEGNHQAEVRAFLAKYYGAAEHGQDCRDPLHTVTAKPRFGLVTIEGADYEIVDIGMRMLSPRELYRAQGFPDGYVIDEGADGHPITKTAQVRMCGNSVSPPVAAALVAANYVPDQPALSRARPRKRLAKGLWNAGALFENAGVAL